MSETMEFIGGPILLGEGNAEQKHDPAFWEQRRDYWNVAADRHEIVEKQYSKMKKWKSLSRYYRRCANGYQRLIDNGG